MFRRFAAVAVFLVLISFSSAQSHAQKLHALVVGDESEWAQWGEFLPNVQMDTLYMFVTLFNNVPENQLNMRNMTIEAGIPGSPADILRGIDDFKVSANDTLMIYFTGHGGADDRGHYLSLEKGKLYRSQLKDRMVAKGARLTVILTDCCNVRGDGFSYAAPAPDLNSPRTVTPVFKSLFFEPSGLVDVNSSAPSESAFFFVEKDEDGMHQGSLFSRSFTKYVKGAQNRRVSWDQVVQDVKKEVHKAFQRNYPGGAAVAKGQLRQKAQNVYAITYPGMPDERGPRTGLTIRDYAGQGVLIVSIRAKSPGTQVYDLKTNKYVSLQSDQIIISANGRRVRGTDSFEQMVTEAAKKPEKDKVMRIEVADPRFGTKEYLMRLSH